MADANVSVSFSASVADFVSGVGEAKDALQSFSAPFGEINGQLASLANASSQAFSADRLQPYRDALAATQSLEQSFAADSARAAAAMRAGDEAAYADAMRAAQLATSEELRILDDASSKSSPSMPRRRGSTKSLRAKSWRFRSRPSTRNTPSNSPRCKSGRRSASSRSP